MMLALLKLGSLGAVTCAQSLYHVGGVLGAWAVGHTLGQPPGQYQGGGSSGRCGAVTPT